MLPILSFDSLAELRSDMSHRPSSVRPRHLRRRETKLRRERRSTMVLSSLGQSSRPWQVDRRSKRIQTSCEQRTRTLGPSVDAGDTGIADTDRSMIVRGDFPCRVDSPSQERLIYVSRCAGRVKRTGSSFVLLIETVTRACFSLMNSHPFAKMESARADSLCSTTESTRRGCRIDRPAIGPDINERVRSRFSTRRLL